MSQLIGNNDGCHACDCNIRGDIYVFVLKLKKRKVDLSTSSFNTSVHIHCCRHCIPSRFLSKAASGSPSFWLRAFPHVFNSYDPVWEVGQAQKCEG